MTLEPDWVDTDASSPFPSLVSDRYPMCRVGTFSVG